MVEFIDLNSKKSAVKILIFGSYIPKYLIQLKNLQRELKDDGYKKTSLVYELTENYENLSYEEKMDIIFQKIEELMLEYDFFIFVFFEEEEKKKKIVNGSLLVELTTFLNSKNYQHEYRNSITLIPKNFEVSMLTGIMHNRKIQIFKYFDFFEVSPYIINFIAQNLTF
ncbi:MAG: hypothetical protein ACTSUG_17950 [Candidatus Helarchaeota archaeon]